MRRSKSQRMEYIGEVNTTKIEENEVVKETVHHQLKRASTQSQNFQLCCRQQQIQSSNSKTSKQRRNLSVQKKKKSRGFL